MWPGKRVLIAGGASFIGSHLAEELLRQGASVRIVDNLSSGSAANLSTVLDRLEFIEGDLLDPNQAFRAMSDVDFVFHLAASHGGRGYIDTHPADCSMNMVLDGIVFNAARRADVDGVCYASSACVYPTTLQNSDSDTLLREDMANLSVPGSAFADQQYGWAKLMGEMSLKAFHEQYGLKGSVCRLFTVYGERENETHAIPALIAKAFVNMDPYEVWGSGNQDRNFTYVSDVARGMVLAAERVRDTSPVNIGSSEHVRVRDVAQLIFEFTGFRPRDIHYDLSKPVGVKSRAADLSLARDLLGWEPEVSFRDGLRRTIDWYYSTHDIDSVLKTLPVLLTERSTT